MVVMQYLIVSSRQIASPSPVRATITLRVRNTNYTLGPVMLHIGMKPGAVIPAHLHKGMAEALYIVEGDFTNEGKQHQAGTSLHFKAGKVHGPHTTKNGCKLLVLWTELSSKESADLSDFTLATQRAASRGNHEAGVIASKIGALSRSSRTPNYSDGHFCSPKQRSARNRFSLYLAPADWSNCRE